MNKASPSIPWTISLSAFLIVFAMWSPLYVISPLESIIREHLAISYTQLSLLYGAPMIMVAVLALPGGLLADRIGPKRAAGIGAIIIAVGTLLRGLADTATELLVFNFIYGVGFGLAFPSIPKLISAWTPPSQTGRTSGLFNFALPLGSALVVTLTLPVVYPATGSVSGTFLVWGIPPLAAAISWWLLVKEPPGLKRELINVSHARLRSLIAEVIRNRNVWCLFSLLFLNEFFMNTMMGWSPALLQLKGASPEMAGVIASIIPWAAIPGMLLMPRLSDRLGLRRPFIWGPSLVLAITALVAIQADLAQSWVVMALVGISIPTRFITILTMLVELVPREHVGTASGLVFVGYLGGAIGPFTAGNILDLTGSFDRAFLVLVAASVAALIIAFRLPETGRRVIKREILTAT